MIGVALLVPFLIGRKANFAETWATVEKAIRTRYYARETRKVEMEDRLARYGPIASAAVSRGEFESTVTKMIAEFHDSHFAYYSRADQGFYLMQALSQNDGGEPMPEIGAWFESTPDGWKVQMLLDGEAAMSAGIRKGDVVQKIDGQPFSPVESLRPKVGSAAELTVIRGGAELNVKLRVTAKPCLGMFLDATTASVRVIVDRGRKIGYVHLWTQATDAFRNALSYAVYGKLSRTDAMVLDLRDGFGGRPEGFGDPFFRPDYWIRWTPGSKPAYSQLFGYGRPLAVLINSGSRSAKEILAYTFKESHRGVLVGRTTAGNVLGTSPIKIDADSIIEIPAVDVSVEGVRLEGVGVKPDVEVAAELDAQGTDLDLAAALERLKSAPIYKK